MVVAKVYGKINLSLRINGVSDGFHMLDSVVASASLFDRIKMEKAEQNSIKFTNHTLLSKDKLLPVVNYMQRSFGLENVMITIENNIPLGGGMGGSSIAITGIILCYDKLFSLNLSKDEKLKIADTFGSDCAFMMEGGAGRIQGKSTVTERFDMKEINAIVVKQGFCDTAETFALYDSLGKFGYNKADNDNMVKNIKEGKDFSQYIKNDLQEAGKIVNSHVGEVLSLLPSSFMTGSGSGVVKIDPTQEDIDLIKEKGFNLYEITIGNYKTEVYEE